MNSGFAKTGRLSASEPRFVKSIRDRKTQLAHPHSRVFYWELCWGTALVAHGRDLPVWPEADLPELADLEQIGQEICTPTQYLVGCFTI